MPSCCSAGVRMVIFAKNFPDVRNVLSVSFYSGQAAAPSIHVFICDVVSARESGGSARPVPGSQAQPRRLVAGVAAHPIHAVAVSPALHVLHVDVAVVALQRRVSRGMAVLTSRRRENFVDLQKRRARCVGIGPRRTRSNNARAARKPSDRGNSSRRYSQQQRSPSPGVSSCAHDFASLPPASSLV